MATDSHGTQIPAKGYLVQETRGVIAVDAPPIIGKDYLIAIAEVTKEPVKIVIYSHVHMDHIGKTIKPLVGITKH
ncbi:MAG: MBL fold metallo-hydrolase [Candidatus Nitrosopolaris sp.]